MQLPRQTPEHFLSGRRINGRFASNLVIAASITAAVRLARERQVNLRVVPTRVAIEGSVDMAHEIFNMVFSKVPDRLP